MELQNGGGSGNMGTETDIRSAVDGGGGKCSGRPMYTDEVGSDTDGGSGWGGDDMGETEQLHSGINML